MLRWQGHGTGACHLSVPLCRWSLKARSGCRAVRPARQALPPLARGVCAHRLERSGTSPVRGSPASRRQKGLHERAVFVLDQHHHPLMPCSEKRARLLLARRRAVVHRRVPFVIRLRDRTCAQSAVQDVALKLDPGSKTTGVALVRARQPRGLTEQTSQGQVHHALRLANLSHRGEQVRQALLRRAGYRRRRRSAHLRHRPARFQNRRRQAKWLPPSLRSRIGNVLTWARRFWRWVPLSRIEMERVKFDTHLLHNPEVAGVAFQRGDLFGWEIRADPLESGEVRRVEGSLPGCLGRRRAGRSGGCDRSRPRHPRARPGQLPADQRHWFRLPTRLSAQSQAHAGLRNGRSGARGGPSASQNGRGARRARGGAGFWFFPGGQDRRDQREVHCSASEARRLCVWRSLKEGAALAPAASNAGASAPLSGDRTL
jgi:hypothetical protein